MAARKRPQPPSEPPRRPALTMSRAEADAKIGVRLQKGSELRLTILSLVASSLPLARAAASGSFEDEYWRWDSYNVELLGAMFTNESIADEYQGFSLGSVIDSDESLADRARRFVERLDDRLSRLRSIRERLELFSEPVQVATPGPARAGMAGADTNATVSRTVFIVHGHDSGAREATARVLEQLDVKPIVLHEQSNQGRTILEKFEAHADVPFAVVLLTPDDVGGAAEGPQRSRARQNVILELGFFWGKLGRSGVCVLYKEGVELPSDLGGLVYVVMDEGGAWRYKLAEELDAAGIEIDFNRLRRS